MKIATTLPLHKLAVAGVVLLFLLHTAHAGILDYSNIELKPNLLRYERTSMFSLADTPIGSTQPQARFQLTFSNEQAGHIELLFFHLDELGNVGYSGQGYQRYLCCTASISAARNCTVGTVVINKKALTPNKLDYALLNVGPGHNATWQKEYNITQSGLYYFFMVNCAKETGNIDIEGTTLWINPYGYLEASEFGFIPFYIVLTILFILFIIIWLIPFCKHHAETVAFQRFMTGILLLGLGEAIFSLADVLHYNADGRVALTLVVVTSTIDTLWRTVGRLLLLSVCMGYGVSRQYLHKAIVFVLVVFGCTYYIFCFVAELVDDLQDKTLYPISPAVVFFTLIPVIILDSIFFAWVFIGLFVTMRMLRDQRETRKMRLYSYLAATMLIGLVLALVMVIFEEIAVKTAADEYWSIWWIFDSWWQFFSFVILCVIALIWRPRADNNLYVYQQLAVSELDPDDENNIEMTTVAAPKLHADTDE